MRRLPIGRAQTPVPQVRRTSRAQEHAPSQIPGTRGRGERARCRAHRTFVALLRKARHTDLAETRPLLARALATSRRASARGSDCRLQRLAALRLPLAALSPPRADLAP